MDARRTAESVTDAIASATSMDRPAAAVSGAVATMTPPGPVKDLLSGTWLGHPLHPLLTDLPIGFWTSAWVLDLIGGKRSAPAARTLVGLGVLTALPTAVSGASDWADTTGGPKRIGVVHAAANSIALVCYGASYISRRRGRRARGVAWGFAGAAAATAGGYLGGHLVNRLGVGVDNTAFDEGPADWTAAGSADIPDGQPAAATAGGVDVLVVREGLALRALADRCSHRGGPLHEGKLVRDRSCVECPWHASVFRLDDGGIERGPATAPQPTYDARRRDGNLEVRARPA
jgi:nitrite reductase/ring-hydroxylating ferredoxin subunit/uncharacterized membrane protein